MVNVRGSIADTYYYVVTGKAEGFVRIEDVSFTSLAIPAGFALYGNQAKYYAGTELSFVIQKNSNIRYIRLRFDDSQTIYPNDIWRIAGVPAKAADIEAKQTAEETTISGMAYYLFSRIINMPGDPKTNYVRTVYVSTSYDGRYWSDESSLTLEVLPTASTPHTHLYSEYYDDSLQKHEYCVYCSPRTEEQLQHDAVNFSEYIKSYAAKQAGKTVFSMEDPAMTVLEEAVKCWSSLWTKGAAAAYDLASFSWSDLIKKMVKGSQDVDKVRKNSVQQAIGRILGQKRRNQALRE